MTLLLALPVVVIVIALSRAYAEVDDAFVEEWSQAHALELTPENRIMVGWYLRTARVLRTWGALAGLFLPSLVSLALGGGSQFPRDLGIWIFVGYLVGALYGELSLVRPVDPHRRSASLVPRDLGNYLPRRLLRAQRVLGALALVLGVAVALVPYGDRTEVEQTNAVVWVVVGLAAALFAAGLERLQAWLVQRPQPFASPSLLAADDAIRAQSVHSLAGSGLAVLLLVCSGLCAWLAVSDVPVLRWTMWPGALLGFLLAIVACLYYGHRAWRVQRPIVPPASSEKTRA